VSVEVWSGVIKGAAAGSVPVGSRQELHGGATAKELCQEVMAERRGTFHVIMRWAFGPVCPGALN
jgi:hypothetical protein